MPAKTYDVILLFGPPIQNKSKYLPSSFFRESFTVISPEELFRENSSLGLRDVTLNVVSALREGKQVFIEDEFRQKSARSSIWNTLKKKVPNCSVLLVKIVPEFGLRQVCWSHQDSYVKQKKPIGKSELGQVKHWFDSSQLKIDYRSDYVDQPQENEGFDIEEFKIPLQIFSTFKFEVPCLFIQLEAALSPSRDFLPKVRDVLIRWRTHNPGGRMIFINDGKNIAKGYLSESEDYASMKRCLCDLAERLDYPVYALSIKSVSKTCSFCVPPHPGILAFLHYQHFIDLHAEQTVYIYEAVEHMHMAQAAGVRHVKSKKLHSFPDFSFKKHTVCPPVPRMLHNAVFREDCDTSGLLSLPLYNQCDKLLQSQGHISQSFDNGLHLSVFVSNMEIFTRAQESLSESLQKTQVDPIYKPRLEVEDTQQLDARTTDNESSDDDEADQDLPVWMGKRLRRGSTMDSISSVENQSGSDPSSRVRCSKTVYIMTEKELQELAFQVLAQAGRTRDRPIEISRPSTSNDPG